MRRFGGVCACVVGFLLIFAPTAPASQVREGRLEVLIGEDFRSAEADYDYNLISSGSVTPLVPTEPVHASSGDRVRVEGTRAGGMLVGEVTPVGTAADSPAAAPAGTRTVAVLFLRFASEPEGPLPIEPTRERLFTGSQSANAFYKEESNGRMSLAGMENPDGDFFGWYTLSGADSHCEMNEWRRSARRMAEEDGVPLQEYDHIVLIFPAYSSCFENAYARGELGGSESFFNGPHRAAKTYAHELGHNLGVMHANNAYCTGTSGKQVTISNTCEYREYGDPFDVMGFYYRHHNAYYLHRIGLVDASQIRTVTESGVYAIEAALAPSPEVAILKLPRRRRPDGKVTHWYVLEVRSGGGVFAAGTPTTTGVSIRSVADLSENPIAAPLLFDTVPGSGTSDVGSFGNAPLAVGQTFDDGSVRIRTEAAGMGQAVVSVAFGPFPDETAPSAPTDLTSEQLGQDVQLDWTASTDDVGVTSYSIFRDGMQIATTPTPSFLDVDVAPGTHAYVVYAADEAGNTSNASSPSIRDVADATAPTPPSALTGKAANGEVDLEWDAAADNVAVSGYMIERGGAQVGTSASTDFSEAGLAAGSHQYEVRAEDAAGNLSSPASLVVAMADYLPPSAPQNPKIEVHADSLVLRWDPSSDDVGVAGYVVTRNGEEVGAGPATSLEEPAPTFPGTYAYAVFAEDEAGNASAPSEQALLTIEPDAAVVPPPDTGAPLAVSLSTRRQGDRLVIWVKARGGEAIRALQLFAAGRRIASRATRRMRVVWQPKSLPRSVSLRARALDASGAEASSVVRLGPPKGRELSTISRW